VSRDLSTVRAELADRRTRAALVADRFSAAFARLQVGDPITVVDIRCDQGDRTLLGKVYALTEGALFSSRIAWLPSDQQQLRPWERDGYLAAPELADLDDVVLTRWLDHLEQWSAGLDRERTYWLKDAPPTCVYDVLTEPAGPSGWLPGLWTRCRRHPQHAENHDRAALLAATRRTPGTARHNAAR
jgi:hypothetical protein